MRHREESAALWRAGLRRGFRGLRHAALPGGLREAAKLILCPVDLWRYAEFSAVLGAYGGGTPVLDIGSPKLLAGLLAERTGADVVACDIVQPEAGAARVFGARSLHWLRADGRRLPVADGAVPFIYAVSALEHIGAGGDSEAMAAIGRALRPGGRAVVTVPAGPAFEEVWLDHDPYGRQHHAGGRSFFSYIYDWPALDSRLVAPSGLREVARRAWADDPPGWYEQRYVPRAMRTRSPSTLLMKAVERHLAGRHIRPWEEDTSPPGRGVVALVLEKPK